MAEESVKAREELRILDVFELFCKGMDLVPSKAEVAVEKDLPQTVTPYEVHCDARTLGSQTDTAVRHMIYQLFSDQRTDHTGHRGGSRTQPAREVRCRNGIPRRSAQLENGFQAVLRSNC